MRKRGALTNIILLMGGPGAGKGTYGRKLSNKLCTPIFSTGEYFRNIIEENRDKELISKIKTPVLSGGFVEDEIICNIVQEKLNRKNNSQRLILDGFPRTEYQAQFLDIYRIICGVHFYVEESILIQKLLGRRECAGCQQTYNVANIQHSGYHMPALLPLKDTNLCDICGRKLIIRHDDSQNIIHKRVNTYFQYIDPILCRYRKQGILIEFEPKKGIADYPMMETQIMDFILNHK